MNKQQYYLYKQAEDPYHEVPIPDTVDYEKVPVGNLIDALRKRVEAHKRSAELEHSRVPIALSGQYSKK